MRMQMRWFMTLIAFTGTLLIAVATTEAQPGGKKGKGGFGGGSESVDDFIAKLMAFNTAKNGKLTKEELTDKRLHALFVRADANKDGVVTRDELAALYQREALPGGGFGGPGGDGKKGKGGPGGKGFKGGPQFGQVLPPFLQDRLDLTDAQRKQIADLQKEVDAKLATILTADQRAQLRQFGPGGFGGKKGPPFGNKKGPPPNDGR